MTRRSLVVCGDDLGLHPAINQGIFRSHEEGVVRAASLVVAGEAVEEATRYARDHGELDVGVHLTLLDVPPVGAPAPWGGLLDPEGCFPPSARASSVARVATWAIRHPDVALAEFDAQLQRAVELGLRPTHLDGHNHLHLLPRLASGVVALCLRWGIPWLRAPRAPLRRLVGWRSAMDRGGFKGALVRVAGRTARQRARGGGVRTADQVIGLGLSGDRVTVRRAIQMTGQLEPGVTEWMVHPAEPSSSRLAAYPWGRNWGREMEALCDERVRDALHGGGIRVVGFTGA